MSRFTIRLSDRGRCRVRHELADAEIVTDRPPEYGGEGRSFSSTDLVAAALGTCTLTTIDGLLARAGHDPARLRIDVGKTLSREPRRIASIKLEIFYPETLSDELLTKLARAAGACPVKRSLSEQVAVDVIFRVGEETDG